jgi:hypothetical protein
MLHFTVEDNNAMDATCQTCCCEKLALKPGTVTKVSVGYASWAVPIGRLHCAPQFQLEPQDTCPVPVGSNSPPQATDDIKFSTDVNAQLDSDLTNMVSDPDATVLKFKLLPLYGVKHGKLDLQEDGSFSYMPRSNYKGEDRFYFSASDGFKSVIFEAMIAVGIETDAMAATPSISIGPASVDNRYFTVSFPVSVSPAANECEIWRLTVLQNAIDCDCTCFVRTDCFDIAIATC